MWRNSRRLIDEIIPIGQKSKVPNLCDSGLEGYAFSLTPSQVDSAAHYAGCAGSQCGGGIQFNFITHSRDYIILELILNRICVDWRSIGSGRRVSGKLAVCYING
jgi:hypothetical protein